MCRSDSDRLIYIDYYIDSMSNVSIFTVVVASIGAIIIGFFSQLRKMKHFKCVSACITCEEHNNYGEENRNGNSIELEAEE